MYFFVQFVPPASAQEQVAVVSTTETRPVSKSEPDQTTALTVVHTNPPPNSWPRYLPHFVVTN